MPFMVGAMPRPVTVVSSQGAIPITPLALLVKLALVIAGPSKVAFSEKVVEMPPALAVMMMVPFTAPAVTLICA